MRKSARSFDRALVLVAGGMAGGVLPGNPLDYHLAYSGVWLWG